jgi:hypothetical protein
MSTGHENVQLISLTNGWQQDHLSTKVTSVFHGAMIAVVVQMIVFFVQTIVRYYHTGPSSMLLNGRGNWQF